MTERAKRDTVRCQYRLNLGGYSKKLDHPSLRARALLLLGVLPIFVALLIYSVTWSFVWDEGFHLIAAHLIGGGKRPYIDFCFPQTPLNAYINAAILLIFGEKWRPVHVLAALYICLTVWLVADFIQTRLPAGRWRTPCALAAAAMFGLNPVVVEFGPSGQAYAIGMLLVTAAFRAALPAVSSRRIWFPFLAGLCAGGAAASTLLTAPVPAVLLVWLVFCSSAGSRLAKAGAYLLGCALPFAPVIGLFFQGPRQTLFNILQYQTLYRRSNWGDANKHDLDALTLWLTSPEALILLVLFAAAMIYLFRENHAAWTVAWREFLLAAALAVAMVLFISTAHPTFERYYCVGVPFLVMVAALGIYAAGSRLASPNRAWLSNGLLITLTYCMFFRSLLDQKDDEHWSDYDEVVQKVNEVTPAGANLFADEPIFFLMQRDPPEGLAFSYAEKLELPLAQEKLFHVVSDKEIKQELKAGHFATFETCRSAIMDGIEPAPYFRKHLGTGDCDVFWEPKADASTGKQ
jgi:hypothetical protein